MPIIETQYTLIEQDDKLYITIPLNNVASSKVDVYSNDSYVKVNYSPYFFELDLYGNINPEESIATIEQKMIRLELIKASVGKWEFLKYTRPDRLQRRKDADKRYLEFQEKKKHDKLLEKRERERDLVRRQIEVEQTHRKEVEDIKNKELQEAKKYINMWSTELEQKKLERQDSKLDDDMIVEKKTINDIFANDESGIVELDDTEIVENVESDSDSDIDVEMIRQKVQESLKPMQPPPPRKTESNVIRLKFTSRGAIPTGTARETEDAKWLARIKLAKAIHEKKGGTLPENEVENNQNADKLKEKGIELFKFGNFEAAINAFTEAFQLKQQDFSILSNRAASYLKQGEYENCINDCTLAIEMIDMEETIIKDEIKQDDGRSDNRRQVKIKLLIRRGTARIQIVKQQDSINQSELKKGLFDYETALVLDPSNEELKGDLEGLKLLVQ
ncbi:hypothetical protein BC833DRAFT_620069 [Globomyces pollinis-pini]|nr:hypothetical protein BC833DRAFT_620069 [Globomyces pollinis-pini]